MPILRELGWDDTNPMEFVPEFSLDNRRVDYALCRGANQQPLIFIEAKKLGSADAKDEERLFGYATNKGVPFLILTDGNIWNFYLSMAAGAPTERRFYRAELLRSGKISEYARFLDNYFQKRFVLSGKAQREAEQRHNDNRKREEARITIPGVWDPFFSYPTGNFARQLCRSDTGKAHENRWLYP